MHEYRKIEQLKPYLKSRIKTSIMGKVKAITMGDREVLEQVISDVSEDIAKKVLDEIELEHLAPYVKNAAAKGVTQVQLQELCRKASDMAMPEINKAIKAFGIVLQEAAAEAILEAIKEAYGQSS